MRAEEMRAYRAKKKQEKQQEPKQQQPIIIPKLKSLDINELIKSKKNFEAYNSIFPVRY